MGPPATALVADAHLGGPGGPAAPLIEQLGALPGRAERLVLLGDIFHFWVGHEKYETAEIAAFAPCLAALRAAGVAVDYVEGNRDFF
nr:UDP-2,3-diacylglucosamine diphosphatase [Thermoanaerobaculia bacterium]